MIACSFIYKILFTWLFMEKFQLCSVNLLFHTAWEKMINFPYFIRSEQQSLISIKGSRVKFRLVVTLTHHSVSNSITYHPDLDRWLQNPSKKALLKPGNLIKSMSIKSVSFLFCFTGASLWMTPYCCFLLARPNLKCFSKVGCLAFDDIIA